MNLHCYHNKLVNAFICKLLDNIYCIKTLYHYNIEENAKDVSTLLSGNSDAMLLWNFDI